VIVILAAQRGICCLELVYLDEHFVRHELDEAAVIGVGAGSRLATRLGVS
jgi:hypothetical protein